MNPANYMKENNVGRELRNVFSIVVPFYVGYILITSHVRLVSLFDYRLMQLLFQTGVLDATLLWYHLPK